ncbi:MAG: hypothetical protein JW995_07550 [Melioribacteraceae bacterium]|nr:hypothetical protein [Melioribacteraceae bacterium]
MIKLKKQYPFCALLLAFIIGCSSAEKSTKKVELEELFKQEVMLNIGEVNAWINLMPYSETRFHISGVVEVHDKPDYNFNYIKLETVDVIQDDEVVFQIKPTSQISDSESDLRIKVIRFSTIKGVLMNPQLDPDLPVNLVLDFYDGNNHLKYFIEKVDVETTY